MVELSEDMVDEENDDAIEKEFDFFTPPADLAELLKTLKNNQFNHSTNPSSTFI